MIRVILIDSGSSLNFINEEVVTKLQFPLEKQGALRVMVANGENMTCMGKCKQLAVSLGSIDMCIDFYI